MYEGSGSGSNKPLLNTENPFADYGVRVSISEGIQISFAFVDSDGVLQVSSIWSMAHKVLIKIPIISRSRSLGRFTFSLSRHDFNSRSAIVMARAMRNEAIMA